MVPLSRPAAARRLHAHAYRVGRVTDMNIFQKYVPDKMNDFHSGVSATVRAVAHTRKVLGSIPGVDKAILKF